MKLRALVLLALLVTAVSPIGGADNSPDAVVRELYRQVVTRKPIGIPKSADKTAIWPFLSEKLIHQLESAQSCEEDYFRKHPKNGDEKPEFDWLNLDCSREAMSRRYPIQLLWAEQSNKKMVPSSCMSGSPTRNPLKHIVGRLTPRTHFIGMCLQSLYPKTESSLSMTFFCSKTTQHKLILA
jgi:hypothetical protein